MTLTKDYRKIILDNIPMMDVRAPVEYTKGAFPNTVNLPILNDEERHIIGIKYKEAGNASATALGYELVSGDIKEARVRQWVDFVTANPTAYLYCFRGGSRSRISQEWLHEVGIDIPRLEGGYKAFRRYLLEVLSGHWMQAKPITLGGHTGSGKTKVLYRVDKAIDLEGLAHHRGSSFGRYIDPQPTQINFENALAYAMVRHDAKGYKHLILEDESRNVGKCYIHKELFQWFRSHQMVLLDVPLEERVQNTLDEYVLEAQERYRHRFGEAEGMARWFDYIEGSMVRVKKRLGGDRFNDVLGALKESYHAQLATGDATHHASWIAIFLRDYYDPMYTYQMSRSTRPIAFRGDAEAVVAYLNDLD